MALRREIAAAQSRLEALKFLIKQNEDPLAAGEFIPNVQPHHLKLIAIIENIFRENPGVTFNTPDLLVKIRDKGWALGHGSASVVATSAKRLQKRDILTRTRKDGYVAWTLAS